MSLKKCLKTYVRNLKKNNDRFSVDIDTELYFVFK